jgi:hypothetical protein
MLEIVLIDGYEYTKSNHRMRYTPEFCENYKKPYSREDLEYLCAMWDSMDKASIAMALGKTHGSVLEKAYYPRKRDLFDMYKKAGRRKLGLD